MSSKLSGSKRTKVLPKSDLKRRKLNENHNSIIEPPKYHNTFIKNILPPTLEEEDDDLQSTGGGLLLKPKNCGLVATPTDGGLVTKNDGGLVAKSDVGLVPKPSDNVLTRLIQKNEPKKKLKESTTINGDSSKKFSRAIGGAPVTGDIIEKNESRKKLKKSNNVSDIDEIGGENDDSDNNNDDEQLCVKDYIEFLFKKEKKNVSKIKLIKIQNLSNIKDDILNEFDTVYYDLKNIIKSTIKFFKINYNIEFQLKNMNNNIQDDLLIGLNLDEKKLNNVQKKNIKNGILKKMLKLRHFIKFIILIKQNDRFLSLEDIDKKLWLMLANLFKIKAIRQFYENHGTYLFSCKKNIDYTTLGIMDNEFSSNLKKIMKPKTYNEQIGTQIKNLLDKQIIKLENEIKNEIKKEEKNELKLKKIENENENKNEGKQENNGNARDIKNILINGNGDMSFTF